MAYLSRAGKNTRSPLEKHSGSPSQAPSQRYSVGPARPPAPSKATARGRLRLCGPAVVAEATRIGNWRRRLWLLAADIYSKSLACWPAKGGTVPRSLSCSSSLGPTLPGKQLGFPEREAAAAMEAAGEGTLGPEPLLQLSLHTATRGRLWELDQSVDILERSDDGGYRDRWAEFL